MKSTDGTEFDAIMTKGSLQFGVKWGTGDTKNVEIYEHGLGDRPITKNTNNPFEGYTSEADLLVFESGTPKEWAKQAPEIYEVARPFLEQGYDLGASGFSAGGQGVYALARYVTGMRGDNPVPMQEGQDFTLRFFDGLGCNNTDLIKMIEGNSDYMSVEVYSSNEKDLTISQASRRWGKRLAETYSNVTNTNYNFTDTTHCGKRYTLHGYTQFIIPDVLPGVTKN